ncbi:hypothetical protein LEMLEM_LOCUS13560, partial [Lemmus lemmus]
MSQYETELRSQSRGRDLLPSRRMQCKELWEMFRKAARRRLSLASTGSTQGQKETTFSEITL